jgi:hypothetical protein
MRRYSIILLQVTATTRLPIATKFLVYSSKITYEMITKYFTNLLYLFLFLDYKKQLFDVRKSVQVFFQTRLDTSKVEVFRGMSRTMKNQARL